MSNPDSNLPQQSPRSPLAPFTEGLRPWLVLARNSVPVIGIYWLGWSADVAVFEIWFDGVTALGAMLAFQIRAFALNGGKEFEIPSGVPSNVLPRVLVFGWLMIFLLIGIPYWFMLLFLSLAVFGDGFWSLVLHNLGIIVPLLLVLASNVIEEYKRGYERMSDTKIRLEFNWEFSMHLARIAVMILVTFVVRLGMIIWLALALSYVEIYPMRTLRFFGGDRTLEADNENRSRD